MVWAQRTGSGVVVIRPGRVLGREDVRPLRLLLEALSEERAARVVVDFSGTRHIHYRAAELLSLHTRTLADREGHLVLAGMSRYLSLIFALLGRYDALEVDETGADAALFAQSPA